MKPIAVLLLVLVAVGALIFGLVTLGSRQGNTTKPVNPDPVSVAPKAPVKPVEIDKGAAPTRTQDNSAPDSDREAQTDFVYANELHVQVVDSQKKPIAGVQVTLTSLNSNDLFVIDGANIAFQVGPLRTGADGRVSFSNIKPSHSGYTLVCMHDDYARQERPTLPIDTEGTFEEPPITLISGATLQGTVKDEQGTPIARARLVLEGLVAMVSDSRAPDRQEALTDGAGMFMIKNIPKGAQRKLSISAAGFGRIIQSGLSFPDARPMSKDFVLKTAEMINGRVVGVGNEPLAKAKIMALGMNGSLQTAREDQETNTSGEFQFESLVPGEYNIVTTLKGWRFQPQNRVHTNTANLVIEGTRMANVCGQVVDGASGAPITQFSAQLRGFTDALSPTAPMPETKTSFSDAAGNYCMEGLEHGSYVVEASAPGYAPTRSQSFVVNSDRNVEHVVIRLTKGGSISGRVVDPDKRPVDKVRILTKPNDWGDDDFTKMMEDMYPSNVTQIEARTGADGSFTLKNLSPDQYQLVFEGASITGTSKKDISVTEGTNTNLGDLLMSRGGTLVGTVLDATGKGVAGAGVQVYSADSSDPHMYQTKSDAEGKFSLRRISQGRYKVRPAPPAGSGSNPLEDMRIGGDAERQITIVDDQETTLDLTLPAASVRPIAPPPQGEDPRIKPQPPGQRPPAVKRP